MTLLGIFLIKKTINKILNNNNNNELGKINC